MYWINLLFSVLENIANGVSSRIDDEYWIKFGLVRFGAILILNGISMHMVWGGDEKII